jgi:hypothetical protein
MFRVQPLGCRLKGRVLGCGSYCEILCWCGDHRTEAVFVQQKIDSQLPYPIKMHRAESVAAGVQTTLVELGADDAGTWNRVWLGVRQ